LNAAECCPLHCLPLTTGCQGHPSRKPLAHGSFSRVWREAPAPSRFTQLCVCSVHICGEARCVEQPVADQGSPGHLGTSRNRIVSAPAAQAAWEREVVQSHCAVPCSSVMQSSSCDCEHTRCKPSCGEAGGSCQWCDSHAQRVSFGSKLQNGACKTSSLLGQAVFSPAIPRLLQEGTYAMEFSPAKHLSCTDFGKHRRENKFKAHFQIPLPSPENHLSPCWVQPNAESLNEAHVPAAGEHHSLYLSLSAFVPCWAELLAQEVTQCQPGLASLRCHQSCPSPQLRTVPLLSRDPAEAPSGAREGWDTDCLPRAWSLPVGCFVVCLLL
ncbi:hypothetical protein EK904_008007, partial [Melospiza melodia maxima]